MTWSILVRELSGRSRVDYLASSSLSSQRLWCDIRRAGLRRRTPGLRRQEVAQLAGISIDYYIKLEQGRGSIPSAQVLSL